jgi:hypothetical protein
MKPTVPSKNAEKHSVCIEYHEDLLGIILCYSQISRADHNYPFDPSSAGTDDNIHKSST